MPRRSFFDNQSPAEGASAGWGVSGNLPAQDPASRVVQSLPEARPREKRQRTWEKNKAGELAQYRNIPAELHQSMKNLADQLNVNVGDIARAFLEYGVDCYERGELHLRSYPSKNQKMTLFSKNEGAWGSAHPGWMRLAIPRPPEPVRKKSHQTFKRDPNGRQPYRGIPKELQERVTAIAAKQDVPVGQVAAVFFAYGLDAYGNGLLGLNPAPKETRKTLYRSE